MPSFFAAVVTPAGTKKTVSIWADDPQGAFDVLATKNYSILSIRERARVGASRASRLVVKAEDLKSFMDQLAVQLDASVPIDEALRNLLNELPEGSVRVLAEGLLTSITRDGKISKAFEAFSKIFPPHACRMIDVGYSTGRLAETFNDLALEFEESEAVRAEARKALHYPIIAFSVSVAVAVFLLGFVMPMFGRVFLDLGIRPPALTRFYLGIGQFLAGHVPEALVSFAVGGAILFALWRRTEVRHFREEFAARAPIVGPIVQALAVARVSGAMKTMQRVGMSAQEGLHVARGLTGNRFYERAISSTIRGVEKGESIGRSMDSSEAFPSLVCLTIQTGEETNRLEEAFERVQKYYSRLAKQRIGKALQWIEPLVTVALGTFVGSVAVSLFYPLVTLAMSIKG